MNARLLAGGKKGNVTVEETVDGEILQNDRVERFIVSGAPIKRYRKSDRTKEGVFIPSGTIGAIVEMLHGENACFGFIIAFHVTEESHQSTSQMGRVIKDANNNDIAVLSSMNHFYQGKICCTIRSTFKNQSHLSCTLAETSHGRKG